MIGDSTGLGVYLLLDSADMNMEGLAESAAARLYPREAEMVRLRMDGMTFAQIGNRFGLSHQRARQIVKNAHRRFVGYLVGLVTGQIEDKAAEEIARDPQVLTLRREMAVARDALTAEREAHAITRGRLCELLDAAGLHSMPADSAPYSAGQDV